LVDDDGNEIDMSRQWSLQSEAGQRRTMEQIDDYRAELEDDFEAKFTYRPLWTGRVLVEPVGQEPFVAYLTDESDLGRLVIDDLTFEIWPEWQNEPRPEPVRPTPLGEL
jgi:hypothetical protein